MSKLPFELYKPIIDELESRSDFIALARTSKVFWSEVISKIYDAVTLGDDITTTLFLSTYRANPALVQLVRDLTVRTARSQFFDHIAELVECINDMTCLKHLSIDYPKANSELPCFRGLFNGKPWMSELHLPHIHSLRLEFDPFISLFKLFGTLPRPLPKLTTSTVALEALTDVTTVYCCGTYPYHGLKHLIHLQHLKVYDFANASSEFMPNLESLIFGGRMMRNSLEGATIFGPFKVSLRMIGPVTFRSKGEVDKIHLNASPMTNLRVVLLRVSPHLRNKLIISRFARACPLLEHAIVFVLDGDSTNVNGLVHYKKNPAESWVLDHIIKDRQVLENWSDWAIDLLRGLPTPGR